MKVFAVVLVLAVASCAARPPQGAESPGPARDVLRFGLSFEPRSVNPIFNDLTPALFVDRLFNDPLFDHDGHGALVPLLARRVPTLANGDISRDGKTITIRLRPGVRWHDGAPFTSADVRFSWQAMMDPKNDVGSREGVDEIADIGTPDPLTAVIHLHRPDATAIPLALPELIPEHLLRGTDINHAAFNSAPVGTGPFRFVKWKHGDFIEFAANDDYYLGKPKIGALRVIFIPKAATAALMLKTGELDIATLDEESYRQIYGSPQVAFSVAPARRTSMFFLNVTRPALQDVRVRHAISYLVDRASIAKAESFERDAPKIANGFVGPGTLGYDSAAPAAPYDPKRAARLLDEAGWKLGPDGFREKDGRRLTLEFLAIAGSPNTEELLAQSMLRSAGIESFLKTYSREMAFAPEHSGGIIARGNFDIFFASYSYRFDPDSSWLFTCAQVEPKGFNESRYCNPHLDALEVAGRGTYDPSLRRRYYAEIQQVLNEDQPVIFLSWPMDVTGINPSLKKAFEPDGTFNDRIEQWSF
jgi:peptide/nickel transport system substrate-binding protein